MNVVKLPLYAKIVLILIGLYVTLTMLYIAQGIIVPLVFAFIVATVLHPVVTFLVQKKINRVVAILLTITVTILVMAMLGFFLIEQASTFGDSWPRLVDKFTIIFNQKITWASGYFAISPDKINAWISKTQGEILHSGSSAIGQTLVNIGSGLAVVILIPIYIFMILFYQPLLLDFVRKLFGAGNHIIVGKVITQIKSIIQRYLVGLAIETVMVAILSTIALLLFGVEYAFLLGIVGALLNIIPYIGGIIAMVLPALLAFALQSPSVALWVFLVSVLIQFTDKYIIIPKVVAAKVKINALVSFIAVLGGSALWGISGMFLSIPLVAILKVICDHIEILKPWGFLLGDTMPAKTPA